MEVLQKERNRRVLSAIIEDYIDTGLPVGSRKITKKYIRDISPATVRNVMADLEETGLLKQPHTSAGRVPTDSAFRFYIDSLIRVRRLTIQEKEQIKGKYATSGCGPEDVLKETSKLIAFLSRHIGIVLAPKIMSTTFKHIEFIKLHTDRLLVIFATRSGIVQNKMIIDEDDLSQDDLNRIARYLNDILADLTLEEVRLRVMEEMKNEKIFYDRLLAKALKLTNKALIDGHEDILYVDGRTNILDQPEFADVEKMKGLLKTIEDKNILVKLLDKAMHASGIQIYIGAESEFAEIENCSVIASSYKKEGATLGVIGVIGPTRMDYGSVIPIVDYTAKVVGQLLEGR